MAQAINAPYETLLVRSSICPSSYTGTNSLLIGLNHSLNSSIFSDSHRIFVMRSSPSLASESRIDVP